MLVIIGIIKVRLLSCSLCSDFIRTCSALKNNKHVMVYAHWHPSTVPTHEND